MYTAAAEVGGNKASLHDQLLKQLRRFVDGAHKPMAGAAIANLGPSYRFHYLPGANDNHKFNLDSAEYANIVCGLLVAYQQARAGRDAGAGLGPRAGDPQLVRARAVRLLDARRLPELGHRPRLQALAPGQEARALAGRAARHGGVRRSSRPTGRGPSTCSTARSSSSTAGPSAARASRRRTTSVCRRSTTTSPRPCSPPRGCRPTRPRPRSSASAPSAPRSRRRCTPTTPTSAGSPSPRPPTTRRSSPSTAAPFPYGGVELARLFDGQQDVAGGVGGRPPASFGLVVRNCVRDDRRRLPAHLRQRLAAAAAVTEGLETALRRRVLDPPGAREDLAQRDRHHHHPHVPGDLHRDRLGR